MELYRSLPRKTHHSTFKRILEYLEASNRIRFFTDKIVYVAGTEKLRKYLSTFAELK